MYQLKAIDFACAVTAVQPPAVRHHALPRARAKLAMPSAAAPSSGEKEWIGRIWTRAAITRDALDVDPASLGYCPHEWLDASGYVDLELARKFPHRIALIGGYLRLIKIFGVAQRHRLQADLGRFFSSTSVRRATAVNVPNVT